MQGISTKPACVIGEGSRAAAGAGVLNAPRRAVLCAAAVAAAISALLAGCSGADPNRVVVYTALDRQFSEPILKRFEERHGIRVVAKYDTEATKTVGLVNAIRAEKSRPRCDVFWNNEIVNTIRLKKENLLEPYRSPVAARYPAEFRDPDGAWSGFAARARVLIVNTNLLGGEAVPGSILAMAEPRWRGRCAMAKPLFGTTATHAACLFALWGPEKAAAFFKSLADNEVSIEPGNRTVAQAVAEGRLVFGWTDTDDAIAEQDAGRPVAIVFPDQGANGMGTLLIPNTLSLIRNAPHPESARKLIDFLLSPEVEEELAKSHSAQIPLNPDVKARSRIALPEPMKAMTVDYARVARRFEFAAECMKALFSAPGLDQ